MTRVAIGSSIAASTTLGRLGLRLGRGVGLAVDPDLVATLRTLPDGLQIEITEPSRLRGSYHVADADIESGGPIWIVPPTIEENPVGTWTVTDSGLYLAPSDQFVVMRVSYLRNGIEIAGAGGPTFTRSSHDGATTITARIALEAQRTSGRSTIDVELQAGTVVPRNPVIMTERFHTVTTETGNRAPSNHLVVALNVTFTRPSSGERWIRAIDHAGSERFQLNTMHAGQINIRVPLIHEDGVVRSHSVDVLDYIRLERPIEVGERLMYLAFLDFTSRRADVALSRDGGPFIHAQAWYNLPDRPARMVLDWPKWMVGHPNRGGRNHIVDRLAVWTPDILPSLTDPSTRHRLLDRNHTLFEAADLLPVFGSPPLIDFSGPASRWNAGAHDGVFGPFTAASTASQAIQDYSQ